MKINSKVIDCCTFFNELDLLRLRIKCLEDHVDYFAVVEASETFTGKPKKQLLNLENASDIISHPKVSVKAINFARNMTEWQREECQRDSLMDLATELSTSADDIIMLSDVDEIPAPSAILKVAQSLAQDKDKTIYSFEQRLFYFRLNYELIYSRKMPWLGTSASKIGSISSMSVLRATSRNLRGRKHRHLFNKSLRRRLVADGGWHFSYLGGDDMLLKKLQSFSHQEGYVQSAKISKIETLICQRASLFSRESRHELWAVIPIEKVGLPIHPSELPKNGYIADGATPASDVIRDFSKKSRIITFKIGRYEIGIKRRIR